jgi:hypothetical protein
LLGNPHGIILRYETALKAGKFFLIAHGSMDDTTHAKEISNRTKPRHWNIISERTSDEPLAGLR